MSTAYHHIAAIYPSLKGTRTYEFEVPSSILLGHNHCPAMRPGVLHFPSPIFVFCEDKDSLEELKLPTGRALPWKLNSLCFSSDFLCVMTAVLEIVVKDNGEASPKTNENENHHHHHHVCMTTVSLWLVLSSV